MWNRSLKHFVNDLKTSLFVIEWSAQKVPRLPELQEMDDKQLNESLSLFYTEAPSKKGEEYSKSSLISFFFFLTYLRNCFVKSFTDILPICK